MNKLASTVSALCAAAPAARKKLASVRWDQIVQAVDNYLADFCEKVDNDTLTFKEGFAVFLGGMALCAFLNMLGAFFG